METEMTTEQMNREVAEWLGLIYRDHHGEHYQTYIIKSPFGTVEVGICPTEGTKS